MLTLAPPADALLAFKTHYHARLWRIRRPDGVVFRFTDHDKKIVFVGETYEPAGGIETSARRQQRGLRPVNYDGSGPITSDKITVEDLNKGLWRDAEVVEYLIDWRYPGAGYMRATRGSMSAARWDGEVFQVEVDSVAKRLVGKQGFVATRNCPWKLGQGAVTGIGCSVDVPTLTEYNVQIDTIHTQRLAFNISSSFVSTSRNRWRFGKFHWTVGNNAGFTQDILDFGQLSGRSVECLQPTPFDISISDRGDIEPGCDKIRPTCINEYNNLKDFRGLNFMPGSNRMLLRPQGSVKEVSNAPYR